MADRVLALVHYYAREGYYRHVQTVCNEVLKKRAGDPVLTFWKAYGLLMEGSVSDVGHHSRAAASVRTQHVCVPGWTAGVSPVPGCVCLACRPCVT